MNEVPAGTYTLTRNQWGFYYDAVASMQYGAGGGGGYLQICGMQPDCWDGDGYINVSVSANIDGMQATSHPNVFFSCSPAEVPELEDYAAAAFLVLALTIGWQVRQRRITV